MVFTLRHLPKCCVWDLTLTPLISSNYALKFAVNRNLDGTFSKEGWYITWEILGDLEGWYSKNGKKFKGTECQGMYLGNNKQNPCCKLGEYSVGKYKGGERSACLIQLQDDCGSPM